MVTRSIIATLSVVSLALGIAARIIPQHGTSAASNRPAPTAPYTLITGDRVLVSRMPDGKPTVSVVPESGGGGGGGGGLCSTSRGFQTLARGQHLYVVPDDAAGYIGAPLSIDLFDVNAMTPDTAKTATTQPELMVEYTSDSAQHLPPGLSKAANGRVAVTDRKQFGAALAQSWRTDTSGGASQLFAGIARIAPAGSATAGASAAPTPPPGKLFTVTVKAFDRSGRPAVDALVELDNVDNFTTYFGLQGFYQGAAAFSVPAGHYALTFGVHTHYPDNSYDAAFAIMPEMDVSRDQTIVIHARDAQLLSVTTPLPASPYGQGLNYDRVDAQGHLSMTSTIEFCGLPLYITPTTSPVSVGKVWFSSQDLLTNPEDASDTYTYDLAFPYGTAIPSTLAETVTAGQLATMHARYHSPVLGRLESVGRAPASPGQLGTMAFLTPLVAPGERTEYVTAQPNVFWQQTIDVNGASEADFVFMLGNLTSYTPGQQTQDDWMAQPMASGLQQETIQNPDLGQVCPLCRSGDTLTTFLFPFTDQHAYMFSFGPATTENLTLYQNGTPVGQLPFGYGATFALSPDPATYKLVYDVSKDDPFWPTPTGVHTAWTFASQERAPDHLPPSWSCDSFFTPNAGAGCSFEPLLFAQYSTAASTAGLDNVIPAGGPATVDVRVSHQRGAAATPITYFAAQVSYDDGQTWQNAPATDQSQGVYRLHYVQPDLKATNGFATLRIQATDSAGSAIDQTVIRAYPLAATAPSRLPTTANKGNQPACSTGSVAPYVQCMALVNTAAGISASQPHGLGPSDIQSAYHLSPTAGQGRTVAIVDAFDDPNAEADLAAYRAHYGLPACTSATGCFTKVNQRGEKANYPEPDPGWSLEISLDLDAVSATCPACHILLVEGDTPSTRDLITSVQTAQRLGANVISNSYGTMGEFAGEQYLERAYRDLTVPFVVSSGDYGYGNSLTFGSGGPAFPAASQYAIAVGGTSLTRSDTPRGWSESAWGEVFGDLHWGATSGCSAYIHKPGWQKDNLCSMRTVADVSAVADPATGLAVYDTFFFDGWLQVGGTSLAAPIISSVYAMAGDGSTVRYASGLYSHTGDLFDVTGGTNANSTQCVNANYLCTGVPGYDGPTGLGTPNGTNAFH